MRYRMLLYGIIFVWLVMSFSCSTKEGSGHTGTVKTIRVFAAAGTRDVTDEICDEYMSGNEIRAERNYASSGTLARQISEGAGCDIFISANRTWIDYLEEKKLIKSESIHEIAGNTLVVICAEGSEPAVPEFRDGFDISAAVKDRIAIGDPAFVPVGTYTKEVFDKLGWYRLLEGRMILAKDVTSVLKYAEMGECDWGVVYFSEAVRSGKVRIISHIPDELHRRITFYIALHTEAGTDAEGLYNKFTGKEGSSVFERHGFLQSVSSGKRTDE